MTTPPVPVAVQRSAATLADAVRRVQEEQGLSDAEVLVLLGEIQRAYLRRVSEGRER